MSTFEEAPRASTFARPRVLVVDDDPDIGEAFALVLGDQGYAARVVGSITEALALVDTLSFQCILTDLFAEHEEGDGARDSLAELRRRTYPTPMIVVTARLASGEEDAPLGHISYVAKPFNLDDLLTTIAASVALPLRAQQERQAAVVHAYFAALTAKDWDALVALCTDDVTYVLPGTTPLSGVVEGKAAFRAYTEETYRYFPDAVFDEVQVYAHPHVLAARFHVRWHTPDGSEQVQSGAVLFSFAGERIASIGVQLNTERLRALVPLMR